MNTYEFIKLDPAKKIGLAMSEGHHIRDWKSEDRSYSLYYYKGIYVEVEYRKGKAYKVYCSTLYNDWQAEYLDHQKTF